MSQAPAAQGIDPVASSDAASSAFGSSGAMEEKAAQHALVREDRRGGSLHRHAVVADFVKPRQRDLTGITAGPGAVPRGRRPSQ